MATDFRESFKAGAIDELSFPTSLDAGRRVLKAIENPDLGLGSLAKVVIAEPLLSAKVIRLANSVALNPTNQVISDVRHAVLRVGMNPVKALTLVLIIDQLRQAQRHGGCREFSNLLWERSVHVAALAYVLASKLTRISPDEAMFAGIVRDLGRFYLLSRLATFSALLDDKAVTAEIIDDLAPTATEMVLNALNVPADVIDGVRASRRYSGAASPESLGDLLYVAGLVSPCADPFEKLDARIAPHEEDVDIGLDQAAIQEVIAASGDEIYSIIVALES
jgi:HD-like signal output (HDOD) protein